MTRRLLLVLVGLVSSAPVLGIPVGARAAESVCATLASSSAREICLELERHGVDVRSLDTGYADVILPGEVPLRRISGAGDGDLAPEIYEVALERCRADWARGALEFCRFLSTRLPLFLVPDDFDEATIDDESLRAEVERIAATVASADTTDSVTRARALYRLLVSPPHEGGLGLRFDRDDVSPFRPLSDVLLQRRGICTELVGFYLMLADRIGLEAVAVEVFQPSTPHLAVGLLDAAGELAWVMDFEQERGRLEGFHEPSTERRLAPISRTLLHAYFLTVEAAKVDDERAEHLIDLGVELSRTNYLLLANKAYYLHIRYLGGGDLALLVEAERLLTAAAAANPRYLPTRGNLQLVRAELEARSLEERAPIGPGPRQPWSLQGE